MIFKESGFEFYLTVPVPQVTVHTHLPSRVIYARYPYIAGAPLTVPSYRRLDQARHAAVAHQIGRFLSALHSFPLDTAREAGVPTRNRVRDERRNQRTAERCVYPLLTIGQKEWVEAVFRDWYSLAGRTLVAQAVVHADFREEHILVSDGGLSGVIDFGDIEIGDPALDVSFLLAYEEDFVRHVMDHYTLPHDENFSLRMQYYSHLRQVVVPAYLFMRGRGEEAARMVRGLPAYIKQNPL